MCKLVLCVLFSVLCYVSNNQTKTPSGLLSPLCVSSYYRMFITRAVPLRNYKYYHEVLEGDDVAAAMNSGIRWRIVGGHKISIEDAPYQVMYGKFCGAALLAPNWVITAAHCKTKEPNVYAGSTLRSETIPYTICAHFVHPLWNTTNLHSHDYDYQLLLLETEIPVSAVARPIAIGSESDIKTGEMVSVSGWGHLHYKSNRRVSCWLFSAGMAFRTSGRFIDDSKKSRMQEDLRRVFVPIMDREECKQMPEGNYDKITSRMFCAGYVNGTKDSCQGDSGGPVVFNARLIGLVSFGVGCASPRHPGVYSNVPMVRDWIRSVTGLPL